MGSPGFCSLCRFRLSESFRFGPEIAACANALLNFADGGHSRSVRVVGSGPRGEVVKHGERSRDRSGTTVFIARSNKGQNGVWGYDRFERIECLEEVYHDYILWDTFDTTQQKMHIDHSYSATSYRFDVICIGEIFL